MGAYSKAKKTRAANLLSNITNGTKRVWGELSPKKIAKWLSPRKRHKENIDAMEVENTLNEPEDALINTIHAFDASSDDPASSDPFTASLHSFSVPGSPESIHGAPAAREFLWKLPKLPKPIVEEVDDEDDLCLDLDSDIDDHQSTHTFPAPRQSHRHSPDKPVDGTLDDPRDFLDVPEDEDELLATSPGFDDSCREVMVGGGKRRRERPQHMCAADVEQCCK
ncbi:hypothetical protein R3P38DRAFT_3179706 [Favolaschia claudopus]|uniref:Uncharacterized protein n=1 Tax=Favolaschia claudopus TaxID=2862362 RepID=A0AAW0CPQ1_9AGAR